MTEESIYIKIAERAIATAEASNRLAAIAPENDQRQAALEISRRMIELAEQSLGEAWRHAHAS